jgi:dihydroorotase
MMPSGDLRPLLLADARLVDPASGRDERGGLLVVDGVVRALGPGVKPGDAPENAEIVQCRGRILAPGLVDLRAFIGEPGESHRETIASASRAAAAGGVTTIVCMPETNPPVDDPAVVDFLLGRARDTAIVRVHPMAAITKGLGGTEMAEIGLLKEAGAVAFSDGARTITSARVLCRALTYARDFDALLVHHTEDPDLAGGGVMNEGELASRLTGGRYNAALITCRDSIDIVAAAKAEGLPVTCSTSINHIALNENDVGDYRTFLKLSPPLRTEDDRQALVAAVAEGTIDCVVSDHNPQDVEQKRQPFAEAADGAIGLETMLVAGLRLVHQGEIGLSRLLRAMSTRPAEILGLPGGSLRPGTPADLVLIDPDVPWVLDAAMLRSKSKNTPFDEARFQGRALRTIVAGRTVYEYR